MDTKVTEQWFEENGWTLTNVPFKDTIDGRGRITNARHIIYTLNNGVYEGRNGGRNYCMARWDHHISVTRDKRGKVVSASNWYDLSVFGNDFHIESRISYRRFTIEQIESALKIVGLK
jgi:hypothetical protein